MKSKNANATNETNLKIANQTFQTIFYRSKYINHSRIYETFFLQILILKYFNLFESLKIKIDVFK